MGHTRRIAVLLGAGASRDAGLPLTADLAEEVLRRLSASVPRGERRPDWLNALGFTYGAMVGYRSRDGSDPLDAVNIETLISALRLLARRESHEVAPFVESWREPTLRSGFSRADERTSRRLVEELREALGSDSRYARDARQAAKNVGYHIAEIAEFARNPTRGSAFALADLQVTQELGKILVASKPVDYLHPLADLARRQPSGLDVITLNYDLTVESAMAEQGLSVDRGLNEWPAQRIVYQSESQLRLHKIHGSLDWSLRDDERRVARLENHEGAIAQRPWVVVGDREKLATRGPTLELVQCATDALERADHLVVAGYGFADDHVNQMIHNWLERDDTRTLGLIEPQPPSVDSGTFRGTLSNLFGEGPSMVTDATSNSRLQGFAGTAAQFLGEALGHADVEASSAPAIDVGEVVRKDFTIAITLTLRGASLHHVHFAPDNGRIEVDADGPLSRMSEWLPGPRRFLEIWARDETIRLRLELHSLTAAPITVRAQGRSQVSTITREFVVDSGYDPALKMRY